MKIALLTDGISPFVTGGMQRHSANLAKYFTLAGVEVTLVHCVNYYQNIPSDDEINKALFGENYSNRLNKIISLKFPKPGKIPGHYVRNSYQYSKNIYELLDWKRYDFVYAKGFCGWYYIEQKKKGINLPPIGVKFHGYEMFQENNSFSQKLKAKILQKATLWNNQHADYVFSYGGEITKLIEFKMNIPHSKIIELTSGIDENWIRNDQVISNAKLKFVFVGRNEKRKGLYELNCALIELHNDASTNFEFHFIGPIPNENKLSLQNVFYYGELKNTEQIKAILDEMDVLVCPSHSEGMPNVILEGMARGLAVIATDVGAVNKIIDNEVGVLIKPFDIEQLKNSIVQMIDLDSKILTQLKLEAKKRISSQFEWSVLIDDLLNNIKTKIPNVN